MASTDFVYLHDLNLKIETLAKKTNTELSEQTCLDI